jgi:hypothetical protein
VEALVDAGLGLGYDDLRLGRTTEDWIDADSSLLDRIDAILESDIESIEQIGSSPVVGLLAKGVRG